MELITEKLFKEFSPVKYDTVIRDFVPYIGIAQSMHINAVIGDSLRLELESQIKAAGTAPEGANPISASNRALLRVIAPALSYFAVYQGLPFHWASLINKGVTIRESENSKGVDIKDISQLRRWVKDDAEFLLSNLIKYLCDCRANYPLWNPQNYCGGCGKVPKLEFEAGIFIPKRKKFNV